MQTDKEPEWRKVQRMRQAESRAGLAGMYSANLWVVIPVIVSLPIMRIFGEGDYIVPLLGVMWLGVFYFGLRRRQSAAVGTVRRAQGFWICFLSLVGSLLMFALCLALALDGEWRWRPWSYDFAQPVGHR